MDIASSDLPAGGKFCGEDEYIHVSISSVKYTRITDICIVSEVYSWRGECWLCERIAFLLLFWEYIEII